MKKLINLMCFMYVAMFIILMVLVSCTPAQNKSDPSKRAIHGIAAIGACIEQGAKVQVRPAAVDGVPSEIIEATVGANGAYEVVIPEEIPISEPAVEKSTGTPGETGFIIRVYSSANGSWIYSYADNTEIDIIANANPYTDKMIRQFYSADTQVVSIDSLFVTGFIQDGVTPLSVPDGEEITQVLTVMSNMLKDTYELSDIQNALIDTWQIGVGLDWLLDQSGGHLSSWLQYEFEYLFMYPDALISMSAIENDYQPVGNVINVEIWTASGETGNVTVIGKSGYWSDTVMVKQSDSVVGNNHYKATLNFTYAYQGDNLTIVIDDYKSGVSVPIALRRP